MYQACNQSKHLKGDTNLRESCQRIDVVGVYLDQVVHEEEEQRRPVRDRAILLARDSNTHLRPNNNANYNDNRKDDHNGKGARTTESGEARDGDETKSILYAMYGRGSLLGLALISSKWL